MNNKRAGAQTPFQQLIDIMAKLRGPDGCPWDKEQTADTIKGHLIEEAYEVVEAINKKDYKELKEELGDLLLQIVFHSQIAKEENKFELKDVIEAINEKLIRRHPHIFAGKEVKGTDEVLKHWEEIKKEERRGTKKEKKVSYLDGVPLGLPALSYSHRLQTKAARVGFDWERAADIVEKLDEEVAEFKEALQRKDYSLVEHEIADLLFTLVNLARKLDVDSESALINVANIFSERFRKMEEFSRKDGKDFAKLSLDEKEELWQKAKERVRD
ncbi:MAG: nucleoside triphosphate pyrophosphohydrolase [Actinobacteria bacterium]|nr:MAG: nucleoside triphosphate pyrophosphohydrolase [Actinomycetota bacterium]